MMGRPGCGKTYICAALIEWMFGKVADIYFIREAKFMARIRDSFDMKGDYRHEIEYQTDHDLLMFDDIGSVGESKSDWRKEVLFEVINLRYESCKTTVFTTNYTAEEIREKLGERSYSRLMSKENTIIDMFKYPDIRMAD
jgi:DNA replication protein DnaC